jgi:hypothetical protein
MTDFWLTMLIGLPFVGGLIGVRLARADRRIAINNEAERAIDE